jgi:phage head maturation protease
MTRFVMTAAPAGLQADKARRTIAGRVVPWGEFARVSTGQMVAFERGSLRLSERAKLILDHDPSQPVAVLVEAADGEGGLDATFRVPVGPRGDEVLAEAAEGLRDGFSVGADVEAGDDRDDGSLWVTAARGRHVALLSEPAFDSARVAAVVAAPPPVDSTPTDPGRVASGAPNTGGPVTIINATAPPAEPEPEPEPLPTTAEGMAVTLTAAAGVPLRVAPARVRDPYPYALPLEAGGPSFVRDAWASMESPGSPEAERWQRAQLMAADPGYLLSGQVRLAAPPAGLAAATGTTVTDPGLVPDRTLPDRFVPLIGAKAPLYTSLTKYPTGDFNTLLLPRATDETGLSGRPADEVTPIAPGNIATEVDTVTIEEVEGAYLFSRKLLLGSNPAIDRIALDALDRAWLDDVERRAVAFFTAAGNSSAWSATYADGNGFETALRAAFASLAASTLYAATVGIPASAEYIALAEANAADGRATLPYLSPMNATGSSAAGYTSLGVQGVPMLPGPYMTANKTLVLDQGRSSAACFATPVMNFRLEWTTDATTGGNVKVLKLVKYSGVGFWAQYPGGVVVITNTTPLPGGAAAASDGTGAKAEKAAK